MLPTIQSARPELADFMPPKSLQNKDCAALTEAIKFIEEVKHG